MELLSSVKIVIFSGSKAVGKDFFSIGLIIILLEDLSAGLDYSPDASEVVLYEKVRLVDEAAVTQLFPDDPSFGEGRAFEDESAVVVVDVEAEGSGVLVASPFKARKENFAETLFN